MADDKGAPAGAREAREWFEMDTGNFGVGPFLWRKYDEQIATIEDVQAYADSQTAALRERVSALEAAQKGELSPLLAELKKVETDVAALREQLAQALDQLGECYRLSGADPDGNENWRLAPNAVSEVRRLREESDQEEEELLAAEARIKELEEALRDWGAQK